LSKLTQTFVKSITTPSTYQDGRGLMLSVTQTGKKYWVHRYQINGVRRDMGLGAFPAVSLKDARNEADKNRILISQGIDPLAKKAEQRNASKQSRRDTFQVLARRFHKSHSPTWSERYASQWIRGLEIHIFPRLGSMPVRDIATQDVLDVLMPIWHKHPVTAERIRNRIELVLDSAKALGLREGENPARWRGHMNKLLPVTKKVADAMASMPYTQVPELMRELDSIPGSAARALELLILTSLRTGEVIRARWSEFDFDAGIWTIPAERMKKRRKHRVPLTQAMLDVIEQQKGLHPELVFPSDRKRNASLGLNSAWRMLRSVGIEDVVPHGFRSSFRTWAGEETDYANEVCEQCLAHSITKKTEAAYSRGDFLEKRRHLMSEWCRFVAKTGLQAA